MQNIPAPKGLTIEDTCRRYGWTRTRVYELLAAGELEAVKAGRRTLVTAESADRKFASLPKATFRAPKKAA